jgi:hypothetical protein
MTPPNVLGTPYPAPSLTIRSTFGAPAGGTTFGGQKGRELSGDAFTGCDFTLR